MQILHQTAGLLCGALIIAGGAGCAIGPHAEPGRNMTGPSEAAPERLVSIGQVFEQQGRVSKADSMYRLALRRDPSNETARRQIAHIASLRRTRTFPATGADDSPETAVASKTHGRSALDIVTRTVSTADPPAVPADSGVAELDIASGTDRTDKPAAVPEAGTVTTLVPVPMIDRGTESYTASAQAGSSDEHTIVTLYPQPVADMDQELPAVLEPEAAAEEQEELLLDTEIPADFDIIAALDAAFAADDIESSSAVDEPASVADIPQPDRTAAIAQNDIRAIEETVETTIELADDRCSQNPSDVAMIQAVSANDSAAASDRKQPSKWRASSAESLATAAQESLRRSYRSAPRRGNSEQVKGVAHLSPVRPDLRRSAKPALTRSASRAPRRPTRQQITAWNHAPEKHVDSLLAALQVGPENRHRALAATLLAQAPAEDPRVNTALRRFCYDRQAAVAAAAGDSLLARGAVTATPVRRLVSLSEHSSSDVRNQVACSMRRLAGTPWESVAIQTLAARLNDADPAVRGMAALTMGDFPEEPEAILEHLLDRYGVETDNGVRASLELAAQRVASALADRPAKQQVPGRWRRSQRRRAEAG